MRPWAGTRSWWGPGTTASSPRTCSPTPAGPCSCWRRNATPAARSGPPSWPRRASAATLCSAFYPLTAASPVIAALDLGGYGLRWRHAPASRWRTCCPTAGRSRCPATRPRPRPRWSGSRPATASAWRPSSPRWGRIKDALLGALFGPFPPVRAGARAGRAGSGPAELLRFARFAVLPVRRLRRGSGSAARAPGCWSPATRCTPTSRPDTAGSGDLRLAAGDARPGRRLPGAEGGGQSITDALVRRLERARRRGPLRRPGDRGRGPGRCRASGSAPPTARRTARAGPVLADVSAPALYRRPGRARAAARPGRRRPGRLPAGTTPP